MKFANQRWKFSWGKLEYGGPHNNVCFFLANNRKMKNLLIFDRTVFAVIFQMNFWRIYDFVTGRPSETYRRHKLHTTDKNCAQQYEFWIIVSQGKPLCWFVMAWFANKTFSSKPAIGHGTERGGIWNRQFVIVHVNFWWWSPRHDIAISKSNRKPCRLANYEITCCLLRSLYIILCWWYFCVIVVVGTWNLLVCVCAFGYTKEVKYGGWVAETENVLKKQKKNRWAGFSECCVGAIA